MNAKTNILKRLSETQKQFFTLQDIDLLAKSSNDQIRNDQINDDTNSLLEKFTANLLAAHAEIIESNSEHLAEEILQFCQDNQINNLWVNPRLQIVKDFLQQHLQLINFTGDFSSSKEFLFNQLNASCSHAEAIIAETGTIVLRPSSEEPRGLSLVPPVHIIVAEKKNCYANLANYFSANFSAEQRKNMPTNLLFISGPSKTADIQQTLAYGAHGPKRLIVILLESI